MPTDITGKGKVFLDHMGKTMVLTLSNTPKNILDVESLQAIIGALSSVGDEVDSIVIAGAGNVAFSYGYDGSCRRIRERDHVRNVYDMGFTISRMISSMDLPVFSVVNGYALGMGLEIALSCDMILATGRSKFGIPDINYGLPSMTGVISTVQENYGRGVYNRLMTGEIFDAETALGIGMLAGIIEEENWLNSGVEYIRRMNLGILSYYKRENMKFSQGTNMDRLFLDFYDLEKIRLKELEAFRDTL
jgi:enoyl-CoA hydratase